MAQARGKNSVRNLRYGPRTRLVRGISLTVQVTFYTVPPRTEKGSLTWTSTAEWLRFVVKRHREIVSH